jgi:hypothetical protein
LPVTAPLSHHPVIPAPLLKPPPRQVRIRSHWISHNRGLILFFSLIVLTGIGFLFYAMAEIIFLSYAPIVTGRIIYTTAHRSSKGTLSYDVTYDYRIGSALHSNTQSVSADFYRSLKIGSQVPINAAVIGWRRFDEIHLSTTEYWNMRSILWLPVFLCDGVVPLLIFLACFHLRALVRLGTPLFGVIKKREHNSTRSASTYYYLVYQFTDPNNQIRTRKTSVNRTNFYATREGEHVVILCDSSNPRRNLLYKYSLYEAI